LRKHFGSETPPPELAAFVQVSKTPTGRRMPIDCCSSTAGNQFPRADLLTPPARHLPGRILTCSSASGADGRIRLREDTPATSAAPERCVGRSSSNFRSNRWPAPRHRAR
jgi:hypothetical protein